MTKTSGLAAAISESVRPGATVLFAFAHNRSHAAAFEVARKFRDTRSLNLVATGLLEYASIRCAAGAVSRLECVLEPAEPGGPLRITAVVGEPNSERTRVERIRSVYGDGIEAAPQVRVLDPPRRDEIDALRAFDPQRVILT